MSSISYSSISLVETSGKSAGEKFSSGTLILRRLASSRIAWDRFIKVLVKKSKVVNPSCLNSLVSPRE